MKLVSVNIEGYRRFRVRQRLQLDTKMVALLGPNEAGKTSVLRALLSLNNNTQIASQGASQDTSRGTQHPPEHIIISAKFFVEATDHDEMVRRGVTDKIRWFVVNKRVDGSRFYETVPKLSRETRAREEISSELASLADITSESEDTTYNSLILKIKESAATLIPALTGLNLETLPHETLTALDNFSADLRKAFHHHSLKNLASKIVELTKTERKDLPQKIATETLIRKVPRFVIFADTDRNLQSTYNLNEIFGAKPATAGVPTALAHLASTANLDLTELNAAAKINDCGKVETILLAANETLKEKMNASWNQSKAHVRFRLDNAQLAILVGTQKIGFEAISERSDGLRQFVSLFAYLAKDHQTDANTILLIDEVEIHLHYDAQADLIQMLARQNLAKQIIYTTHSIGALPEDLGLGVRLIQPSSGSSSEIINKFWAKNMPGLSPVLIGMGAATMAFLPVRFCVLTEGAADILLLPTLLREMSNRDTLGFQVAPGLSEAGDRQIAALRNEGRRVLYLIDGDDGGNSIRTKLHRAGVSDEEIIQLRFVDGDPFVIEDFVAKSAYVSAVNSELDRSGRSVAMNESDLPDSLRPNAVEAWCKTNGVQTPKKVDVAYRILEDRDEKSLIEDQRRKELELIYRRIDSHFQNAPPSVTTE